MDKPILRKLYTAVVHNMRMCMKKIVSVQKKSKETAFFNKYPPHHKLEMTHVYRFVYKHNIPPYIK